MNITISDPTPAPCPFCGHSDIKVSIERDNFGSIAACACQICGATVHGIGVLVPEDGGPADELTASALKAWNHRSPSFEPGPTEWVLLDGMTFCVAASESDRALQLRVGDDVPHGRVRRLAIPNTRTDIGRVISALMTKWHEAKEGT